MNPDRGYTTNGEGALVFWGETGRLNSKLYLESGPVTITLRAGGHTVDGAAPSLTLNLGNSVVGTLHIVAASLRDYTVTATVEHAGTIVLGVSLTNGLPKPIPIEGRWVRIEALTIVQ